MATFSVMPMSKEIELKPGEVYTGSITVSVPADAEDNFNYQVVVNPYSVVDEYYTADFVTESDWSKIVKWTEVENPTGTIEPNENKEIKYKITAPADAPAGGQYAMISVRSNAKDGANDGLAVRMCLRWQVLYTLKLLAKLCMRVVYCQIRYLVL